MTTNPSQKDIQTGAPHELISNPSSQKVTSSQAFTTGAGNEDNANIYDGTGSVGTDQYSRLPDFYHCIQLITLRLFSNIMLFP